MIRTTQSPPTPSWIAAASSSTSEAAQTSGGRWRQTRSWKGPDSRGRISGIFPSIMVLRFDLDFYNWNCALTDFRKGQDIMDVWFDSGISWSSLPESENEGVSDIYLEGIDQVRDSNLTWLDSWWNIVQNSCFWGIKPVEAMHRLSTSRWLNS